MSPPRCTKTLAINPPLPPTTELRLLERPTWETKKTKTVLWDQKHGQVNGWFYSKLQNHLYEFIGLAKVRARRKRPRVAPKQPSPTRRLLVKRMTKTLRLFVSSSTSI